MAGVMDGGGAIRVVLHWSVEEALVIVAEADSFRVGIMMGSREVISERHARTSRAS